MFINRGNHEAKDMNRTYGFEGEAKHKHGEQSYKVRKLFLLPMHVVELMVSSSSRMLLLPVSACFWVPGISLCDLALVPLATLLSASKPPAKKDASILTDDGRKRYFVVHGGLFSKDDVSLDDIKKIDRIGRQPGQEGLMCASFPRCCYPDSDIDPWFLNRRGEGYLEWMDVHQIELNPVFSSSGLTLK